jgi:hypothetical protein
MASQLEVIKFRDLLPVQGIPRFVPGFALPTLEIKGDDFRTVEKILINEVPAPEFIIVNKHTIYVQLPDAARNKISNIQVVSSKFTKTNHYSVIQYELGTKTKTVSGLLKLVQLFVKWMLQSPNSDIFNPARGGGMQELVGKVQTTKTMDSVASAISRAVSNTVTQIRAAQVNTQGLPLDERLLGAEIQDIQIFEKQMEARVKISIRSVAGQEAVAALEL